jgi:hypothetical protein
VITDQEIALIKAMTARDMKIADMQFYFNRQDRPVNTGRFADIRAGRYGRSAEIQPATQEELQTFLDDHAAGRIQVEATRPDPLAPATLKAMFEKMGKGAWRLLGNETDRVECKETFHLRGNWLRALAALANNQGGYIFFGVRDNDAEAGKLVVVGMRDEVLFTTDPLVLTRRIRSTFDPTPVFQIGKVAFGKKVVGVIHVDQHPARPIVATKQDGDVAEGDIYYRYPGQSLKIKYSDLRTLLDERDARVRAELQPMLNRLVQLGPRRAMVADLATNELTDGRRTIRIDKELADKLTFIKEGHFVHRAGTPALRLVGDVRVGEGEPAIKKGIVNRAEMLADFLDNGSQADPVDYLRFAIEMSNGEWLPIRHFARLAGMDDVQLVAFIESTTGGQTNKNTFKGRIGNQDAAFQQVTGRPAVWLARITEGEEVQPSTAKEAGEIGRALQGIAEELPASVERLRTIAGNCLDAIAGVADAAAPGSYIRRGIARLDELIDKRRVE